MPGAVQYLTPAFLDGGKGEQWLCQQQTAVLGWQLQHGLEDPVPYLLLHLPVDHVSPESKDASVPGWTDTWLAVCSPLQRTVAEGMQHFSLA